MHGFLRRLIESAVDRQLLQFEQFFPWEQAVLSELMSRLSAQDQVRFARQMKCTGMVQRHKDGEEVNLYRDWRWRVIRLSNRLSIAGDVSEHRIAHGIVKASEDQLRFEVFAIDGCLFSLEFSSSPASIFRRWDQSTDGIRAAIQIFMK
ncbi:hypothetical protein [Mitsuaria sp. GD03876]|uniref:hypothetical protein n=1 Tax=Mitsuaria sp. GD03876 TaxID=2975399 RepID=UPI0024473B4B|nr:hypothetical protein [Mitsuaria sp. GD03876]MDH0863549.1 hypothetical protein [Mitsuaria sp. GD03876]